MATKWLNRWHGVAVVLLGAFLLALLTAEKALPAREETKAALPSDLAKIPTDAWLIVSGRVADIWNSEWNKTVRQKLAKEVEEGAGKFEKSFGVRPEQIERLTMVLIAPPPAREEPLLFVRTTKAYERAKVIAAGKNAKEQKYKGHTFYAGDEDPAVYPLDEQSIVYGSPTGIRGLIDHPMPKAEGGMAGAMRVAAGKHMLAVGLNVKTVNDAIGDKLTDVPAALQPLLPLRQATWGTLVLDMGEKTTAIVKLTFPTEKEAKTALKAVQYGKGLASSLLARNLDELAKQKDMAKATELLQQIQTGLKDTKIEQEGQTLQASARFKTDVTVTSAALAGAVQRVREAAVQAQAQNNLKQIGLAMHNYAATFGGRFPPQAIYDKNGKPLLSWRVMTLPFIEQEDLYKQFHLDEPWDSEHNKKLLAKMPKTYASPSDGKTLQDYTTYYQGFVGKGAFFEGKKGLRLPADFPDGTSNTFMIVEASKAVPWTKPEDIPYDASKPLPKLIRDGAKGFLVSLCDGSVRVITKGISEKTLRNAITRNDGNPLGSDF